MRNIATFFLLGFLFASCQSNLELNERAEFKNIVGEEDYNITMEFISTMESKLSKHYNQKSIVENYTKYLHDVIKDNTNLVFDSQDCEQLKSYSNSNVDDKYYSVKYDTVYLLGEDIVRVLGNDTISFTSFGDKTKIDNEIAKYKKLGHDKIDVGKILEVLEVIGRNDPRVVSYIQNRKELTEGIFISETNPKIGAKYLIEGSPDFENMLAFKLLVLSEFYIWEIKEANCP